MESQLEILELERRGLKQMKVLIEEYLAQNKGSDKVRKFLEKASKDDDLLLIYLKGRKYRPEHAWETLKRKAEVRFDEYPEAFVEEQLPYSLPFFVNEGIFGLIKQRDKHGCRIFACHGCKWDTEKFSMQDVTQTAVHVVERLHHDKDAINNGCVFIQNCENMGLHYAKHYTLPAMLRFMHLFWFANPLKVKRVYYINMPFYLQFIWGVIRPFLPKKLKERFIVTSKGFEVVHANVNPDGLPKYLGGPLESHEAFEPISYYVLQH